MTLNAQSNFFSQFFVHACKNVAQSTYDYIIYIYIIIYIYNYKILDDQDELGSRTKHFEL